MKIGIIIAAVIAIIIFAGIYYFYQKKDETFTTLSEYGISTTLASAALTPAAVKATGKPSAQVAASAVSAVAPTAPDATLPLLGANPIGISNVAAGDNANNSTGVSMNNQTGSTIVNVSTAASDHALRRAKTRWNFGRVRR